VSAQHVGHAVRAVRPPERVHEHGGRGLGLRAEAPIRGYVFVISLMATLVVDASARRRVGNESQIILNCTRPTWPAHLTVVSLDRIRA
jgi:hypothetical protein